jgi:predicted TIM-barrel fold metal-dependent hydrolase
VVDAELAQAEELLERWEAASKRDLPAGLELFDAHVHLGTDIDGMLGIYEELEEVQARYGITRCFVFCLDEPDRHPAFSAANDRTLAHAERAAGRLIPFVRLDLSESPVEEATRCLDLGAKGIKLHPRAQGFLMDDSRLDPVFALAAARRVPILIHGGRGLPPIADHLAHLVDRYPDSQLIIAHAGIADLAALAGHFGGRPGVYFDTSCWSAIDLLDFFRQVSPQQVLYASDYPYLQQPSSLLLSLRSARSAGLSEEHVRGMLWDNAARIAHGEPQAELTAPVGSETFAQPIVFARIHSYLTMATPMLFARQADRIGALGLALNACSERDGHRTEQEQIRELLTAARDLWRVLPELEDEADQRTVARTTGRLVHIADIVAVTVARRPPPSG